MTPDELVEAVARAIREDWRNRMSAEDRAETLPWEDIEAEERADCIAMARAALRVVREAMREPSVDMEIRGTEDWICVRATEDRAAVIWRAMLAASPLGRIDA
jgi:hypothetical protein